MTDPSGPPAGDPAVPDYSAVRPTPPSARWSTSEIISWVLIILLAVIRVVQAGTLQEELAGSAESNFGLPITSRYAVAVHSLMSPGVATAPALSSTDQQLLDEADKLAKSPEDQVRIAILHGEFEGPAAALSRLDSVHFDSPSIADDSAAARIIYSGDRPLTSGEWDAFHDRYGWFAELALAQGKPAGDPDRVRALGAAYRTVFYLIVASVIFGIMTMAGITLLIIALVLWSKKRITMAFQTPLARESLPPDRRAYVQAFAVYLAVMTLPSIALGWAPRPLYLFAELVALPASFALGFLWPIIRHQSFRHWRMALGLHTGRGFFREIFSGILGYLAGIPVMLLGLVCVVILSKLSSTTATHPINQMLDGSPIVLVVVFLLASVWAPITEELMFRGALFSHLRERFGWWISAPLVALIFAIIHPQGWVAIPALASIALVLAGIREWRGSILGCMAAHALHNSLALIFVLLITR